MKIGFIIREAFCCVRSYSHHGTMPSVPVPRCHCRCLLLFSCAAALISFARIAYAISSTTAIIVYSLHHVGAPCTNGHVLSILVYPSAIRVEIYWCDFNHIWNGILLSITTTAQCTGQSRYKKSNQIKYQKREKNNIVEHIKPMAIKFARLLSAISIPIHLLWSSPSAWVPHSPFC